MPEQDDYICPSQRLTCYSPQSDCGVRESPYTPRARDVDEENSLQREWNIRRGEIVKELEQLRKGGLTGVRLKG
jgi:hypothetical protein